MAIIACFGEVLLRLVPQDGASLRAARGLDAHVGGAEANVAAALSQLGHDTRLVTLLPENELGELPRRRLASEKVDLAYARSGPGRMGLYFHNPPAGPRGGNVLYDRAGSAFALGAAPAYDFEAALDGVGHVHLSGISPAVSEHAAEASLALVELARAKGCTISFDGNFRSTLWQGSGRDPRRVLSPIVERADLLFGDHRDAGLLLGRTFDEAEARTAAQAMFAAFPRLQSIASTMRSADEAGALHVAGRIERPAGTVSAAPVRLADVVGRIGTGDAFAAGVLHRWLTQPGDDAAALAAGLRLMAIKHATPGDLPDFVPADLESEGPGALRR